MGNQPVIPTGGASSAAPIQQPAAPIQQPAAPIQQPAAAADQHEILPIQRSWKFAGAIAGIMLLLTLIGVALTTASKPAAPPYWISLAPIFGILCAGTAWARHAEGSRRAEITRQILHWLGVAVAMALDFMIRDTGEETGKASGLNAMLLLALGCFLAGVHLEWHFAIVGLMLSLALIVVAKAEEYVWLVFVVGALATGALFGLRWWLRRGHQPRPGVHAGTSPA
jgi:hypothetical protein